MATSRVPIVLPADPTAALEATTKQYVDTGLLAKAGVPYFGAVPAGSATATITHNLGTLDVDVAVYRVSDGLQVGVPNDRVDTNTVTLTFATAPTAGQYRVVVSAGTGAGGAGGGGGLPELHASTHATAGSDPVSPGAIGAATSGHNHDAAYSATGHTHSSLVPAGGAALQVLAKDSSADFDVSWHEPPAGGGPGGVKPYPPVDLLDAATVATDAALGTHFRLVTAGNRTLGVPTNPTSGQVVLWEITASGAARTLTLATGTGGFVFGTDITAISATSTGLTDYIQAVYDERAASNTGRWRVISYVKGFPA